ncbi:copper chaperone PCu(A)C [Streptomyces roseolus]|uniref:hypothetical protein n=1 Tax=Streptomyces roseolus TaxID=67358 RepID=UPI0036C4D076
MKTPVSVYVTTVPETTWVRWLPNALPAAGYTTLKNSSDEPIDVTKIKTLTTRGSRSTRPSWTPSPRRW